MSIFVLSKLLLNDIIQIASVNFSGSGRLSRGICMFDLKL